MKANKTAPPRRRISFAVDRDEIEINSDWVEAVMAAPPAPPSLVPQPARVPFPGPPAFAASGENNTTGTETATDAECTSVEDNASVDSLTPVVQDTPVINDATVEISVTPSAEPPRRLPQKAFTVVKVATVADPTSDELIATDALLASAKDHRLPRPRRLLRITDGLTPGQYAVYSLMYEAGEPAEAQSRIYKGGYADLGRLTGLSKRGIQNIVAELQAKLVIGIHRQPGYHRTETTAYLVPVAEAVLQLWQSKGWRNALGKSKLLAP